jgi:signal transduction histidine kinase
MPEAGAAGEPGRALLTHNLLLGQRLYVHGMARLFAAAAIVIAAFVARDVVGVEGLDVAALTWLAVTIVAYDLAILALIGPRDDPIEAVRRFRLRRILLHASIVIDFLALTVAVWLVGGARSPFVGVYFFHIVIASFLLSRRAALASAGLAIALVAGLTLGEYFGLFPSRFPAGAVLSDAPMGPRYVLTTLVVYTMLFAMIAVSQASLAEALRGAERDARERESQLERLSAMRKDFLHLALHDVHSPVGAASALLQNLRDGLCGPLEPPQVEQLDRALAKLDGIGLLLSDLRVLSELDALDLADHSTEVSLLFLLRDVVDDHREDAEARGLTLRVDPDGEHVGLVDGVPRLLRAALENYVTNAVKYTPRGGEILARVREGPELVRAEVADNGPGVSPEDQRRLFQEFVRVGRDNPAIRGIPGIGLGLSIVRRIAEAHGGRVGLRSAPGQGSAFWIELPRSATTGP